VGIHVVKVPDIGEGIAEVEVVEWHVKPGDVVAEEQVLADVMTDKASVEIPSPVAGKVVAITGKPGDTIAVGSELIRLEVEGAGTVATEAREAPMTSRSAASSAGSATTPPAREMRAEPERSTIPNARAEATTQHVSKIREEAMTRPAPKAGAHGTTSTASQAGAHGTTPPVSKAGAAAAASAGRVADPSDARRAERPRIADERPIASPAVRRRAWDLGVDLRHVSGTGPGGRIMQADLDAHVAAGGVVSAAMRPGLRERNEETVVPVIGLRRQIARKMQASKRQIPHFTYVEEVDVTELEALRTRLNVKWQGTRGHLTLLPFLVRAIVCAVPAFTEVNARYDDDESGGKVTQYGAVHAGIATQTDGGLMVPVLRHAEACDLWTCAAEIARLADAARSGRIGRDELSGSTITITSLGALGGIVTTPVINHPEVAIVGVNRAVERPVMRAGAIVPRRMMNLSSSFDHRVVDGLRAAGFVQALRGFLEAPATLFIE